MGLVFKFLDSIQEQVNRNEDGLDLCRKSMGSNNRWFVGIMLVVMGSLSTVVISDMKALTNAVHVVQKENTEIRRDIGTLLNVTYDTHKGQKGFDELWKKYFLKE